MQKVVVVTADSPLPLTGGGSRTYYFTEALAKIASCNLFILFPVDRGKLSSDFLRLFNIVLISKFAFGGANQKAFSRLMSYIKLILTPWLLAKPQLILNADYLVNNAYKGDSFIVGLIYRLATYSSVYYSFLLYKMGYFMPAKTLERKNQFDELHLQIVRDLDSANLLWVDFSSLLPIFNNIIKADREYKVIVNAHNIEFLLLERLAEGSKSKLARKWLALQADLLKREELKGFKSADLVIVCSDHDKQIIQQHMDGINIKVMPNGVDLDYFHPSLEAQYTPFPSLLFTGTMGYYPNREAVKYFVDDIFPLIKESLPKCKFIIAGANAEDVLSEYNYRDDIVIYSSPEDMRPIYNEAWVVVVPLKTGSGTRLKILEALAMRKLVVSTSIGAEGLDLTDEEIVKEDLPFSFANKTLSLLKSSSTRFDFANKGYNRICKYYSWDKITKDLEMHLMKLMR